MNYNHIKRIDPLICTHIIYLEDESKPFRQPQCLFNPIIKDVVNVKVLKLLNVGIIYLITNSVWVSPIQVFT